MRRIVLSVVACCAVIAILPASALAHRGHHKRHHARVHHRTFGQDWSQSGNSGPSTSTSTSSDQNAGTVVSFAGGVLTIALNNGQTKTVSGDVTSDTEIECQAPDTSGMVSHETSDGGGDSQGDNNQGNNNQGDDDGGNASCSSADLTPGTVVHEARLSLSGAGATWDKVELVTASASNNTGDNDNDGD